MYMLYTQQALWFFNTHAGLENHTQKFCCLSCRYLIEQIPNRLPYKTPWSKHLGYFANLHFICVFSDLYAIGTGTCRVLFISSLYWHFELKKYYTYCKWFCTLKFINEHTCIIIFAKLSIVLDYQIKKIAKMLFHTL